MTRSFSSLCIANALCLTSFWILIAVGIFVTKMQKDQEKHDNVDIFIKMNLTILTENTTISRPSYYLPAQSLKTISRSMIWLGFVLDFAVCFTEFMVVWLKVQAPPVCFYLISALRYLIYILHPICWDFFMSVTFVRESMSSIAILLCLWTLNRLMVTVVMCFMNKELSK